VTTQLQAELQKKNRQIDNLENTLSKTSTEIEKLKKDVAELRKVRPAGFLLPRCCQRALTSTLLLLLPLSHAESLRERDLQQGP
jgi:hypothetical protein